MSKAKKAKRALASIQLKESNQRRPMVKRGLRNLKVNHVSELAAIGFTPRKVALVSQSVSFVCWLLLYSYHKDICPE